MPINIPLFQPQVNPGSQVNLPPSDDFSTSVVKGYEMGKILSGIRLQEDQLKQSILLQDLETKRRLLPLQEQESQERIKSAPFQRSELVSGILGQPGVVTNVDTGPRIPTGTSSMDETLRFAAPEGGGQVPADALSIGLPGMPGVGRSPSLRQAEEEQKRALEDERWFKRRDYMVANPIGGTSSVDKQKFDAIMETLTPQQRLQVIAVNNNLKGRLRGNPQAMTSIAEAISVGATMDEAMDFVAMDESPNLFANPPVYRALRHASLGLKEKDKDQLLSDVDNYLDPKHVTYSPNDALKSVLNASVNKMGEVQSKYMKGSQNMIQHLTKVKAEIDALPEDERTGIINGNIEKLNQAIGRTGSKELARLAVLNKIGMQQYVNSVTGVAFPETEYQRYLGWFPDIVKNGKLNMSLIDGLMSGAANHIHGTYSAIIGEREYKALRNHFQDKYGFFDEVSLFPFRGIGGERTDSGIDVGQFSSLPDGSPELKKEISPAMQKLIDKYSD